jgi:outer membrane protein
MMDYLDRYNEKAGYDYILNGANVLVGPEVNNITADILNALNEEYEATKTE